MNVLICSANCAEQARSNFQEKKDKGVEPGRPMFEVEQVPDVLEDNIDLD